MQYETFNALAHGHDLGRVDVITNRELTGGDDAFGLEADVEQYLIVVNLDHGAGDEITIFEFEHAIAHEGGKVGANHVVFGDDARHVSAVHIKGSHLDGGKEAGAFRHANFFHTTTPGSTRQ